jgi:hypothetical protein
VNGLDRVVVGLGGDLAERNGLPISATENLRRAAPSDKDRQRAIQIKRSLFERQMADVVAALIGAVFNDCGGDMKKVLAFVWNLGIKKPSVLPADGIGVGTLMGGKEAEMDMLIRGLEEERRERIKERDARREVAAGEAAPNAVAGMTAPNDAAPSSHAVSANATSGSAASGNMVETMRQESTHDGQAVETRQLSEPVAVPAPPLESLVALAPVKRISMSEYTATRTTPALSSVARAEQSAAPRSAAAPEPVRKTVVQNEQTKTHAPSAASLVFPAPPLQGPMPPPPVRDPAARVEQTKTRAPTAASVALPAPPLQSPMPQPPVRKTIMWNEQTKTRAPPAVSVAVAAPPRKSLTAPEPVRKTVLRNEQTKTRAPPATPGSDDRSDQKRKVAHVDLTHVITLDSSSELSPYDEFPEQAPLQRPAHIQSQFAPEQPSAPKRQPALKRRPQSESQRGASQQKSAPECQPPAQIQARETAQTRPKAQPRKHARQQPVQSEDEEDAEPAPKKSKRTGRYKSPSTGARASTRATKKKK